MKVIIIVVRSKWGHKILTKEKLAEIRKKHPEGVYWAWRDAGWLRCCIYWIN